MTPGEFQARLERLADRGTLAAEQGRAAAVAAMVGVQAPGHMVSSNGSVIRVEGPRAKSVARTLRSRARRAASAAVAWTLTR